MKFYGRYYILLAIYLDMVLFHHKGDLGYHCKNCIRYSLKFLRGKCFVVLAIPLKNKFSRIKLSWSRFQPHLASFSPAQLQSVKSVKFSTSKILGYTVPLEGLSKIFRQYMLYENLMKKLTPILHPSLSLPFQVTMVLLATVFVDPQASKETQELPPPYKQSSSNQIQYRPSYFSHNEYILMTSIK